MGDSKYGRIVAERKEFGEEEPLFVLRAQDVLAPTVVEFYADMLRAAAVGAEVSGTAWDADGMALMASEVDNVAASMRVWQGANGAKFPD